MPTSQCGTIVRSLAGSESAIARPAAAWLVSADDLDRKIAALEIGAPVAIRVNPRARRLLLKVDTTSRRVELVMPYGVAAEQGLQFLASHRGWIAARLEAVPKPLPFTEGAVVPVFGVPHRIVHEARPKAPPVAIGDGEIRVRGDPAHIGRRVRDHLAALARRELGTRARGFAAQIGKTVVRVSVRETKSRWGSCSSTGNLSFSWRLVFAPDAVVDYVVAHEVAHLAEMNHSPRFWRVVASLVQDHAGPRAWLKRHRARLFSYG